jgi:uncharacterized protein
LANSGDFKVLACDGGGIRGLITTVILERLEQKLGSPLNQYFDMFAGTSTGSIIACCIAKGMPAADIRKFYVEKGKDIFPNIGNLDFLWNSLLERLKTGDFSLPLFPSDGLDRVLQDANIFGQELFGTLPPTIVVAYDAYNRTSVVFKSHKPKFAQIPIWEVCRSSSAAPTAFAGHVLTDPTYIDNLRQNPDHSVIKNPVKIKIPPDSNGVPLIDGGVVANNPSLCAIAEGLNLKKSSESVSLANIFVASFGTGQMEDRITANEVKTWGILDWLNIKKGIPLLDVYADGSADLIDYIATQLLQDKYDRYQPLVPNSKEKPISTFQADPQNLANLVDVANDFLDHAEGDRQLDELAAYLSA